MRTVAYKGRSGPQEHRIYEAGDTPPESPKPWRTAPEGSWVATDDGCVVQVLKAGHLRDGTRWIRTCTGTFRCIKDERLDTEPRQNRYTFNGKSPSFSKVTPGIQTFARLAARGMEPKKAYQAAFPRASDAYAEKRARWLLKKKEVREVVASELGDLMDGLGITEEFILVNYKDIATDPENQNARVSALKMLSEMRGMLKKQTTTMTASFKGIPQDISSRIGAAEQAIGRQDDLVLLPEPETPETIRTIIGDIPQPESVDLSTLEASLEVTMEESDSGTEDA